MDLGEKISILAGAAKYDASCASSGSSGRASGAADGGLGYREPAGICHSWTGDGRCISLLKVLYSNVCRYDCAYCVNRASADTKRVSFTSQELADLTIEFYRRNYIEGLFLSSGIFSDPDIVMEKLIETAKKLRTEHGYGGYIHMKIIPGTGDKMIREAGLWADRLSANIELPTDLSLKNLAPQKNGREILGAMEDVADTTAQYEEDRRRIRTTPDFAPSGQSTQLIVGASEENDRQIISLSGALYRKFGLRRVYYSAFTPVGVPGRGGIPDPRLPDIPGPPLVREHRLYQADWLLRFYHFSSEEILDGATPFLDKHLDPKTAWALKNLRRFPIEINRADYEELLRVPGIGATSARRIIEVRRSRSLSFDSLRRIGVVLKRARYFITVSGGFIDRPEDPGRIRRILSDSDGAGLQLPLFDF
ncbi:putative DNA modification/repair radical SAM protein [Breznakiella homolactica]|uniref:Putative DNA modification/repair radical SAM protein n=1 Tax=Breznakiella homolactica TaxID=2798577 RepID=A0A7T8BDC3_9SPIR|nr:putative DNA modification/repair radical SAM protein [Breznakiella homolactica]QQO11103.1 putative DNA modification/repair radical SAM protein [Breznakiella homolactica]